MKKSGLADSPLFKVTSPKIVDPPSYSPTLQVNDPKPLPASKPKPRKKHDIMTPRYHDTTVSRYHETIVPIIRKAVKEFGKEAATHRFTLAEKKSIADIIYTYKNQGVKTSENEIARIAVNFVIEDFKENGETSVLDTILKALRE